MSFSEQRKTFDFSSKAHMHEKLLGHLELGDFNKVKERNFNNFVCTPRSMKVDILQPLSKHPKSTRNSSAVARGQTFSFSAQAIEKKSQLKQKLPTVLEDEGELKYSLQL